MRPEQFARARRALSGRLVTRLIRLFLGLESWRDADAARFVAQVVPLVQGNQRSLAALTAAFVAAQAGQAVGGSVAAPGIPDSDAIRLRQGVDPAVVYRRPFVELYRGLAAGKTMSDSLGAAEVRLREIAEMDLQQTYARASRAALRGLPTRARPRFWRRVLIGPENCALCVIASTQRYTLGELNPIHPGCDCTVAGIWGADPGQVIEPDLLEQVHTAVQQLTGQADRGGRAPDYRQLTVQMTREHGELGPLLVRPNDRFTGPGDLTAAS